VTGDCALQRSASGDTVLLAALFGEGDSLRVCASARPD